jgi:hypothetical protein
MIEHERALGGRADRLRNEPAPGGPRQHEGRSKTLKEWKAKRAGGRITVYGTDVRTGEPAKLVGVDEITPRSTTEPKRRFLGGNTGERHIVEAYAVAVDMHGTEHRLLIA